MISALLSPIRPPADDMAITAAIAALKRPEGGAPYLVGLRNHEGAVYRQVVCRHADDLLALTTTLEPFGFVIEAEGLRRAGMFFAHVFSRRTTDAAAH